jgi:hypothetical protein
LVGVYLSLPLARAIWSQSRATMRAWAPRIADTLGALRF